jgi:hypothetical protein
MYGVVMLHSFIASSAKHGGLWICKQDVSKSLTEGNFNFLFRMSAVVTGYKYYVPGHYPSPFFI